MTRLTRLTNILLQLQSKRIVTSKELAGKFGISQRTVYRDIKALEEAGVPIIGEVGEGYSLVEDYRIPPLMFTEQEINALLTARQFLKSSGDKSVSENIEGLVTKIKAILKYSAKEKTEKFEQRVRILTGDKKLETELLSGIQSAIVNSTVLKIKYHTIYSDQVSERFVDPLAVYFTKNNWVLIAHCRLRNDLREFRLDRILSFVVADQAFTEREFSFEEYINLYTKKS